MRTHHPRITVAHVDDNMRQAIAQQMRRHYPEKEARAAIPGGDGGPHIMLNVTGGARSILVSEEEWREIVTEWAAYYADK